MTHKITYEFEGIKVSIEADEILQVCDRTMYRLVKRAMITENMFNVVKLGQVYRINRESFLNWIDSIESTSL